MAPSQKVRDSLIHYHNLQFAPQVHLIVKVLEVQQVPLNVQEVQNENSL
jgi:hypothetical protein